MLEVNIPGFGLMRLEHLVSDFTSTLSFDGRLLPGLADQLNTVAQMLQVHILTADTFGRAQDELKDVHCTVHILSGSDLDRQKVEYVLRLRPDTVVALGNGTNDRRMLKAAKIGIADTGGEGCSVDALIAANIHVVRPRDGLDLLLCPKRLMATLRF